MNIERGLINSNEEHKESSVGEKIELKDGDVLIIDSANGSLFEVADGAKLIIKEAVGCMVKLSEGGQCEIEKGESNSIKKIENKEIEPGQIKLEVEEVEEVNIETDKIIESVCPACNSVVPSGANFCGDCGHKMKEDIKEESNEIICPACNSVVPPGANFCGSCGHKM